MIPRSARPSARAAAAFAALVAFACGGAETPPPAEPVLPAGTVRLTPAQLETARVTVDTARIDTVAAPLVVPGIIATPDQRTAHVGSLVEGRVDEVLVLPGDVVRAGQALVAIHSHEVALALRDLRAADAQVRFAKAALDRSIRLLAAEAVAREEVERRQMQFDEAEAERRRAEEIVEQLHPNDHNDAVIVAPQRGTVFQVHARPGAVVRPGDPLVDLGDATRLWVTGYVPEAAAVHFRPGTRVTVRPDALPGVAIPAVVVRVGASIDSLKRALEVRVELGARPDGVRSGMFASMELPAAGRAARVVLPADAVQRMGDGEVVFVVEGPGLFRALPVRAEPLDARRVAVDGLAAGTPVVTGGAYAVRARLENTGPAE
ncbi:MAG: efflux RND transporter periplasmic adaptor subunit [Gemmatimonadales bacterium]|nr:efflux RND transporter periplasmic adaptor subunit [Gemmatimonadales bacterium]